MISIGLKQVTEYGFVVVESIKKEGEGWKEVKRSKIMSYERASEIVYARRALFHTPY